MVIYISPDGSLSLRDETNFRAFKVSSEAASGVVERIAQQRPDDLLLDADPFAHMWIAPALLHELSPHGSDADWRRNLAGMAEKAREFGWIDKAGRIRAHVEWISPAEPSGRISQ